MESVLHLNAFINIIYALEKAMSQRITDMEMYSLLETVFDFFFVVGIH